jgi:hypothetical protein
LHSCDATGANGGFDFAQPVRWIVNEAIGLSSSQESLFNFMTIKFATGYELMKTEAGAVQRVITDTTLCADNIIDFPLERRGTVSICVRS